jgi:uncharacterized protein (TIGR03083 family)
MMNPPPALDHLAACDELERVTAAMATLAARSDPDSPVPTCPRWRVADLLTHTGHVHRWVTRILAVGATTRPGNEDLLDDLPVARDERAAWFADGIRPLHDQLRSVDPATPVWTWSGNGRAGFWSRRMLYETLIHYTDLRLACGQEPVLPGEVAPDGISELLSVVTGRHGPQTPEATKRRKNGAVILVTAADRPVGWSVRLLDGGLGECPADSARADAQLCGPAGDLLLVLYRRMSLEASRCRVPRGAEPVRRLLETLRL